MEQVKEQLEKRQQYLLRLRNDKENVLANAPKGFLRISSNGDRVQYFIKQDSKESNGTYIRGENSHIARALAQRDYDKKVLRAIEQELKAIQKYLSHVPEIKPEQIYENLHKERQKLVLPIQQSEKEYVEGWESVEYQGKGFHENTPEFFTAKGERVRSKSEVIIADLLNREGIPYRYEYPIMLKGIGKVHPDFTVLHVKERKELYWEHLGMMDNADYAEKAVQKISTYAQNGILPGEGLILTYETQRCPINQKQILLLIQHYLRQECDIFENGR